MGDKTTEESATCRRQSMWSIEAKPDAKDITGLVKSSGRVTGLPAVQRGRSSPRSRASPWQSKGEINGVGVATATAAVSAHPARRQRGQ